MKITYIHHSAFLVETESAYLLFDYFQGKLPEFSEEKPLYVFASHRHPDHFSKEIIELEDSFQLCTRKEYYDTLIKVAKQPKKYVLTDVQLEVLSIIAYKQPVTRQEVEKIRGVNSDHALNRLVEYGLVGEAGRLDAPGRPILFGTTEEFLRNFGVRTAEDLPSIQPDLVEEMKSEAEEEVQLKLNL